MSASQPNLRPGASCKSPSFDATGINRGPKFGAQQLDKAVARLTQQGRTDLEIESYLAQRLCIVPIDGGVAARSQVELTSSTNTDLKVSPPSLSHDTQAHLYYSITKWNWNNSDWKSDRTFNPGGNSNVGGPDGIATSFNKSLILHGYSASYWGNGCAGFGTRTTSTASDANAYGAGFTFQDVNGSRYTTGTSQCYDYNAIHGQEVISFKATSCTSGVQAFGRYGHTWSSTSLAGFNIGAYSIGISWTSTSHRWYSSSQPSNVVTVCST